MSLSKKGLVAMKFSAVWCAPCRVVNPLFDKMKSEFGNITFESIDVDDQPMMAKEHRIRSVPTVILFKDGQEIDRIIGTVTAGALRKLLRDLEERAAA